MKNFNYAAVSGGRGVPCGLNTIKSLISCLAYNITAVPCSYATPYYAIFAATLFWIGSKKIQVKLF